jgi:tetratricopeptide (TPR) repeat protein
MRIRAALLTLALATPAWGDSDRARVLYEQGERAYNLGRYADAAKSFQAAYVISGQAGLLFNIAQSFRQAGDCGEALKFYRSYVRAKPAGDPDGAVARRIDEMQACVSAKQNASEPPPPPPARPPPPSVVKHDEPRNWLPWMLAGTGAAFVGAGAAVYGWTKVSVDDCAPRCSPSRLDSLHLRADLAYASAAIGGASLIVAGWLWWRERSHDRSDVGFAASPSQVYVWGWF